MPPELSGLRLLVVGDRPLHEAAEPARAAGAMVRVLELRPASTLHRRLSALASAHDVVHLHATGADARSWSLVALVGAMARGLGSHAAVTVHGRACATWLVTPARALLARLALAPYDEVIATSEPAARALRRIGARVDRLTVAAPGEPATRLYARYVPHAGPHAGPTEPS